MKFSSASAAFFIVAFIAVAIFQYGPAVYAAGSAPVPANATSSLQDQINADNQQIGTLNQQIATYQAELQKIGADKTTLKAAINALDLQRSTVQAQVSVTQRQINTTQLQIQQLGGEITNTQQEMVTDRSALGAYLRDLQKADGQTLLEEMLSSNNLTQIWSNVSANLQVEDAVQTNVRTLQEQETNLANSQTASQQKQAVLNAQQQSLASQQQSLVTTEQSKTQLLAETNAKESTYQQLLAAAEAELNSFSAFVQNAGGSKLLGNQTVCDSWGCYYSQRDAAWGSDALNGTRYTLASDGCLVASMAMVMTHYGYRDVTPVTINSNPANFAAYYSAYLLTTINVDGVSASRKTAAIDATLKTGNPVIVGVHAYGGTHFIVLVSGSKGNYLMRDPYVANGKDISLTSHYSVRSIFSIAKVVVGA